LIFIATFFARKLGGCGGTSWKKCTNTNRFFKEGENVKKNREQYKEKNDAQHLKLKNWPNYNKKPSKKAKYYKIQG
jgi:hypothetical protein